MSVDLRKLEHFVAVAEELNFTRAAQRLHISQQALSTSVRSFERELGVVLLERDRRQVVLTAAGATLLDDAPWLLRVAGSLSDRVRAAAEQRTVGLRVGRSPAVASEDAYTCLRPAREAFPDAALVVDQRFPAQMRSELLDGQLDVVFSRAPIGHDRHLSTVSLIEQRLRVAMASDHPLSERSRLRLTDLAAETVIVWGEPGKSAYTDALIAQCREHGIAPHFVVNPVQGTAPVTAVDATPYLAFVTEPSGPALSGAVVVRDVEPEMRVPILATWVAGTTHAVRDALLHEDQRVV